MRGLSLGLFLIILYFVYLATQLRANPYDYQILRVIDGDTVEFEADFLPGALKQKMSLRIYGVDTPEKSPRAHCPEENLKSLNAKLFTEQEIMNAMKVQIYIKGWDKYGGRVIGDVILDGEFLSTRLIASGYARPYFGEGPKSNWCTN
jgi:endonuclease YncB( thermonuclease family)